MWFIHLLVITLLAAIGFLRYLPLRHLMRRSCSILSLCDLIKPCESDSQTSGTLLFYDIICFLTHVSCSVSNCCMFEGASHFHRHFFANQSLSPIRGVVKSLSRCDTLFHTLWWGPFLSPKAALRLAKIFALPERGRTWRDIFRTVS